MRILPSAGVYFTALNTRLENALRNSASLPLSRIVGSASRVIFWFFWADNCCASLLIDCSKPSIGTGWLSDG
ncbi:hypothetical protein D3C86_1681500 [compost metagenome]